MVAMDGRGARQDEHELLRFRAGRLMLDGTMLRPDNRRGLVRLVQSEDDGLFRLRWSERTSSENEVDVVVVPGECSLQRLKGRSFEVNFPDEKDRNLFFWAQEPKEETDEQVMNSFNLYLHQTDIDMDEPHHEDQQEQCNGARLASGDKGKEDQQSLLAQALQQALQYQAHGRQARGPSLNEVITKDIVKPLLRREDIREPLLQYLPEGQRGMEDIEELISSPQFQSQLERFSMLIASGEFDLSQFDLKEPPASPGVVEFLEALLRDAQLRNEQNTASQSQQG